MNERKLIWPDMAEANPDLVLSIGTSYNKKAPRKSLMSPSTANWGMVAHWKQLAKIAIDHVQSTLDCEMTWNKFRNSISGDDQIKRSLHLSEFVTGARIRRDSTRSVAMNELHDLTTTYWARESKTNQSGCRSPELLVPWWSNQRYHFRDFTPIFFPKF
jgi:hypothetical protein